MLQALIDIIDNSIADGTFMATCQTGNVPKLLHKVVELVKLIAGPAAADKQPEVVQKMQDVYEVLLHDLISPKIRCGRNPKERAEAERNLRCLRFSVEIL